MFKGLACTRSSATIAGEMHTAWWTTSLSCRSAAVARPAAPRGCKSEPLYSRRILSATGAGSAWGLDSPALETLKTGEPQLAAAKHRRRIVRQERKIQEGGRKCQGCQADWCFSYTNSSQRKKPCSLGQTWVEAKEPLVFCLNGVVKVVVQYMTGAKTWSAVVRLSWGKHLGKDHGHGKDYSHCQTVFMSFQVPMFSHECCLHSVSC